MAFSPLLAPLLLLVVNTCTPAWGEKCRECSILGDIAEYYCPRAGYPATHTYCCGPGLSDHCCPTPDQDYAEYASNLNPSDCNQLPMILSFLAIVISSIVCCCCVPLLCCCYTLPCCPWYQCRKINKEHHNGKQEEEVPMASVAPAPAPYQPQPAYPVQPAYHVQQPVVYLPDQAVPSAPPQPPYNPSY